MLEGGLGLDAVVVLESNRFDSYTFKDRWIVAVSSFGFNFFDEIVFDFDEIA